MCTGPGHVVVYGNQAFREVFGTHCVGLPAREGLVGLPGAGFAVLDAVLARGRPAARWLRMGGVEWRITAAPRRELGTNEVYGVSFHLRRRDEIEPPDDVPAEDEPGGGGAEQ